MDRQRRTRLLIAAVPTAASLIAALLTGRAEFYALGLLFFAALLITPCPRPPPRSTLPSPLPSTHPSTMSRMTSEEPAPVEAPPQEPRKPLPARAAADDALPEERESPCPRLLQEQRTRRRAERSARLHRRVAGGLRRHLRETVAVLRDSDRRERLARAAALQRRLADLEDLRDLEGDRLEVDLHPFSPRRLAEELLARHGARATERGITLSQQCHDGLPPTLVGDPGRLGRALDHLLENAVEAGGSRLIRVFLEPLHTGNDRLRLRITVSDGGPGLSRERIAALTEPGVDPDETEGEAVGLYFARALTEAMGGSLGVESAPGEGSRFWLELPVEARESALEGGATTTVLVAEDEEATRMIVTALLEQSGCRVIRAVDGRQAVERAAEHTPELVLMDLQMPEMDGFEAARRILAQSPLPPRIVAMSATDDPREEARAQEAGMPRFITKPLTLDKLRALLSPRAWSDRPDAPAAAVPAEAAEEPAAAVFNPQRLTEMIFDLSAVWIDKVTRTGAVSISETAEALAAMDPAGELEPLRAAAHKLKGAAGNNGLDRLRALAAELERHAREGEREPISGLLAQVDPLVEQSLEALAAWKENPRG
ncbi:response regulator [Endothiovibrio diazotrophicus]